MTRRQPFWRRRLLVPVAVLAGLNGVVFTVYTLPRLVRERSIASRLEVLRSDVQRQRAASEALIRWTDTVKANTADTERFLSEVLGTRTARLVPLLQEIEKAAHEQGLGTRQGAYNPEDVKGMPLVRFAIAMPLSGSYDQLVRFLRRIEASKQFLIVDQIQLAERRGEGGVELSVALSTYFRREGGGGRGR